MYNEDETYIVEKNNTNTERNVKNTSEKMEKLKMNISSNKEYIVKAYYDMGVITWVEREQAQ